MVILVGSRWLLGLLCRSHPLWEDRHRHSRQQVLMANLPSSEDWNRRPEESDHGTHPLLLHALHDITVVLQPHYSGEITRVLLVGLSCTSDLFAVCRRTMERTVKIPLKLWNLCIVSSTLKASSMNTRPRAIKIWIHYAKTRPCCQRKCSHASWRRFIRGRSRLTTLTPVLHHRDCITIVHLILKSQFLLMKVHNIDILMLV